MKIRTTFKKIVCTLLTATIAFSAALAFPSQTALAKENVGNGVILSTDVITVTEGGTATFTALLPEGLDASRLACVVANPGAVSVTPVAYAGNAAAFQVDYLSSGSTVAAVYHMDNPAVVAYVTINASTLLMDIPSRLGTNRDNYCKLTSYAFVPYDFPYADFNDYKYTLNIQYQCVAYNDDDYSKWGCYGYFYDAAGNVLSKVHLYCSTLTVGRTYHSEFNVPVNAVRFRIEGF